MGWGAAMARGVPFQFGEGLPDLQNLEGRRCRIEAGQPCHRGPRSGGVRPSANRTQTTPGTKEAWCEPGSAPGGVTCA